MLRLSKLENEMITAKHQINLAENHVKTYINTIEHKLKSKALGFTASHINYQSPGSILAAIQEKSSGNDLVREAKASVMAKSVVEKQAIKLIDDGISYSETLKGVACYLRGDTPNLPIDTPDTLADKAQLLKKAARLGLVDCRDVGDSIELHLEPGDTQLKYVKETLLPKKLFVVAELARLDGEKALYEALNTGDTDQQLIAEVRLKAIREQRQNAKMEYKV
jgi:hypothetical protein